MTMNINRHKLIVIAGPTGSGKTDLGIRLATHYNAPIISADSRQLFKGMPIGTAQPTVEQLAAAPHYMIATHEITEPYTCARYESDALAILDTLFADNPIVIAVGGSGLYIDALCHGMDEIPETSPSLRESLTRELADKGLEALLAKLKSLDPEFYEHVDRNNPARVMRALEVCLQTGQPYSALRKGRRRERSFDIVKIGIDMPRNVLYERINRRVDMMIEEGLESEARALHPYKELNSLQTVGYREMFDYFDGKCTLEQAVELIKRNSRRYAKRQMTWFRRDEQIRWFLPSDRENIISYIDTKP